MKKNDCFVCGKTSLSRDEVGTNKKLLGHKIAHFYCINCLASYLDVTVEELQDKIEEFKREGCKLFG
jgi:hypothetical protein